MQDGIFRFCGKSFEIDTGKEKKRFCGRREERNDIAVKRNDIAEVGEGDCGYCVRGRVHHREHREHRGRRPRAKSAASG